MQAKGRLQCWNADGAGKGQAATLEQQRLTARGLGGSCREECHAAAGGGCKGGASWNARDLEGCKGLKRLKPGRAKQVPHLRF